jgi:hypothetical protein
MQINRIDRLHGNMRRKAGSSRAHRSESKSDKQAPGQKIAEGKMAEGHPE